MFYVSAEASLQEVQLLLSHTAPVTSQLLQMEPFSAQDAIETHVQSQTEHQVKNKEKNCSCIKFDCFLFLYRKCPLGCKNHTCIQKRLNLLLKTFVLSSAVTNVTATPHSHPPFLFITEQTNSVGSICGRHNFG